MMDLPPVVSREEWLTARKELLVEEKTLTRARDALNTKRRELPMVKIDKEYVFAGPEGKATLLDLFDGRRQLIVDHVMWLDDEGIACPSCSARVDNVGHLSHLHARNTTYVAVSRGPLEEMQAFQTRMSWTIPWYSSEGSDFNYDFHVSFDESIAPIQYNYLSKAELEQRGAPVGEWEQPFDFHGTSAFLRDADDVFHTYSAYARGTEQVGGTHYFLDMTALGRQEEWEQPAGRTSGLEGQAGGAGVLYHDEYDE